MDRTITYKTVSITMLTFALLSMAVSACGGSNLEGPVREGRDVYGSVCSACHGSTGKGGVGPAFAGVVETFPSCDDHIKWVTLGSERWKAEVGEKYGATDKPIKKVMPEIGLQLSEREIAAVAAYERSTFAGVDVSVAEAECGFAEDGTFGSPAP
jgi:mono/diheme cytochrome c family protein